MNATNTAAIRVNTAVFNRLRAMKRDYESWSCFFDRVIPESRTIILGDPLTPQEETRDVIVKGIVIKSKDGE